jgi:NAD-dependent DNA ligase
MTTDTKKINFDELVPKKIEKASKEALRALINWADYCYWVKDESIMSDYLFDSLIIEYKKRYPEDEKFLNKLGMW